MRHTRRREFITLLGGAAAWPFSALAQQPSGMRRIGVLLNFAADDPEAQAKNSAFLQSLQQLGWTAGRNVRIDTRWGAADADRVRKYVRRNWSSLSQMWFWPKAPQS
jgi:putative ABC transport system substrate-binding protein